MALFKRKDDNNVYQNDYFSTAFTSSNYSLLINERQAMQLPAFKACMQLIENTISQLPIKLQKKHGENIEFVNDKSILMLKNPNPVDTAATLMKQLVHELLLYGRAYIYVNHNHLHVLKYKYMKEKYLSETGFTIDDVEYIYNLEGTHKLEKENVIRFDLGSEGVLSHDEVLETALNAQKYNKSLLKNGTFTTGVLKAATRLTDKAIENLRKSWNTQYQSAAQTGKTIILEEGIDYKPLQNSPEQLQLNESDKALTSKICMLFNVSESLISDNSNKYNSLSYANTSFLQQTISPLLNVITTTLNKYFFDNEKMQFVFDTSMILRTTEKENVEVTATLLGAGIINLNEARERINYSVVDDEQNYYELNIGKALRNVKTGEVLNINTQQTNKEKEVS